MSDQSHLRQIDFNFSHECRSFANAALRVGLNMRFQSGAIRFGTGGLKSDWTGRVGSGPSGLILLWPPGVTSGLFRREIYDESRFVLAMDQGHGESVFRSIVR